MTKRSLIIRKGSYCEWKPKKNIRVATIVMNEIGRKTSMESGKNMGFANPVFVVFIAVILAGMFYLYTINKGASLGMEMRENEKNIMELKEINERLRIQEAELKSLYHVKEASKNLNMVALRNVDYVIEDNGHIALAK